MRYDINNPDRYNYPTRWSWTPRRVMLLALRIVVAALARGGGTGARERPAPSSSPRSACFAALPAVNRLLVVAGGTFEPA
jgi:hypothetical protein